MISILISNHFLMDFVVGLLLRNPKAFHGGKLCKFTISNEPIQSLTGSSTENNAAHQVS